eukprot:TRINITY_DN21906_c0_g1_i1.p1 TRINITY_DN21906_c0_g1~~TRINITY_DN21906_c0_g1_i1.p1  ORF type:complete len:285 (+),score=23.83 TRINITY_DN21906_c0_g1_i1:38-892(+)
MSVTTELVAGGIAGAAGILSTQPLDTIRIRLQSSAHGLGRATGYAGLVDCALSTMKTEGLRGLYKGVASPTLTVGAMNAVLFFTYERASASLSGSAQNKDAELSLPQVYAAGASAGLTTAFITGPTELIKCIAQTNLKNKGHMYEEWLILRSMVRDHGWLGAYGPCRGLLTTIVRETPSMGLYFTTYEAISRAWGKSSAVSFFAGGCAGAIAWTSIYPLDVIKTRWSTAPPGTYSSLRHCFTSSVAQEGWGMLFKGFGATMARAWPQNAVIFFTYEMVRSWMVS